MANGIIELTRFGNATNATLYGRMVWNSVSNGTAENTSKVSVEVQLKRPVNSWTQGTWQGSIHIGSVVSEFSRYLKVETEWITVASTTATVSHNADGSGACYLYCKVNGPVGTSMEGSYVTGSSTVKLDNILRYASIVSVSDFTDEGNPVVNYSNPAGNSVNTLQVCISLDGTNAAIAYKDIPKAGTSYTLTLTEEERNILRAATPDRNTLEVFALLKTVIGGVSNVTSKPARMNIINAAPAVSATVVDTNTKTTALTGDPSMLVALHSKAKVTINAAGQKYATITNKTVTHGAAVLPGNGTLSVTNHPIIITAVDSRGNATSQNAGNTIVAYIDPTCVIGNNMPETDGSFILVAQGLYYSGAIGKTANTLAVQYRYKAAGGNYSEWTDFASVSKGTADYEATASLNNLDYRTAYVFQARAIDQLNPEGVVSAEKTVVSQPIFYWSQNDFHFNVPVMLGKGIMPTLLTSADDLNEIRASGWYEWKSDSKPANIPAGSGTNYMSSMRVWKNGNTCYQECVETSDSKYRGGRVQRVLYGATVYDWEWVNAPNEVGPEYRTTERWKGKPVYVRVVDCGTLPNKTSKYIQYAQSGVVDAPIDYYGVYSNQAVANAHVSFVMVVNKTHIIVDTPNDLSTQTLQVAVKYTKV